ALNSPTTAVSKLLQMPRAPSTVHPHLPSPSPRLPSNPCRHKIDLAPIPNTPICLPFSSPLPPPNPPLPPPSPLHSPIAHLSSSLLSPVKSP
ncbi:unnamed protein product, partial [Closterium sp. NIES-53]